jgi:hypothetical protein
VALTPDSVFLGVHVDFGKVLKTGETRVNPPLTLHRFRISFSGVGELWLISFIAELARGTLKTTRSDLPFSRTLIRKSGRDFEKNATSGERDGVGLTLLANSPL